MLKNLVSRKPSLQGLVYYVLGAGAHAHIMPTLPQHCLVQLFTNIVFPGILRQNPLVPLSNSYA